MSAIRFAREPMRGTMGSEMKTIIVRTRIVSALNLVLSFFLPVAGSTTQAEKSTR